MPIMIFMTSCFCDLRPDSRLTAIKSNIKILLPAFLILTMIAGTSCKEKPTIIGNGLLPGEDFSNIKSTDTLTVKPYVYTIDSVVSNNQTYSFFGGLHDPYFGNTYCDFVSQLRLTQKWPGGVPTVDSVRLYITVSGVKGTKPFTPTLNLYEITEMLSSDSSYLSNRDPRAGKYIGSFELSPVTKDTVTSFSVFLPPTFGEYLLRDTLHLIQGNDSLDFRSFFRGIYVSISDNAKSGLKGSVPQIPTLLYFNPAVDNFLVRVFYHTQTTSSLYYDFIINDKSVRYNRYLHDYSAADPGKQIKGINDSLNVDTIVGVQTLYGLSCKIRLYSLEKLKDLLPLSVNKARLTFTVYFDGTDYTVTNAPTQMYLYYNKTDSTIDYVPDYYVSSTFADGKFNSTSLTYSFNLAAFVQEYLEGKISKPVVDLYLPENMFTNVLLRSVGSKNPPKFSFVYTRF